MALTDYKIGQWVRVVDGPWCGQEGEVTAGNYSQYVYVKHGMLSFPAYYRPEQLELVEDPAAPAKADAKPELGSFVTAWEHDDGFSLTDADVTFTNRAAANAHADCLVRENVAHTVVVLKMVSKHSSAVTVTSEDV